MKLLQALRLFDFEEDSLVIFPHNKLYNFL